MASSIFISQTYIKISTYCSCWNWIGTELFKIESFKTIDEITDRVLYDLVNKTGLGTLKEGTNEFSKKSYGKDKPYEQKVRYTQAFLDDIYLEFYLNIILVAHLHLMCIWMVI